MTLQTLYSLRIFFRLTRIVLGFFVLLDGTVVVAGVLHHEFNRELLIYAAWTALCTLLVILSSEVIKIVSSKILKKQEK